MFDYLKNSKEKEESKKMEKNLFRLSDGAKCDLLFDALNSTPEDYKIVCDIYDDYAIAYDAVNGKYLRAYYTKDNEANTVAIDRVEDCYIVDVTEAEMTALNAMKAAGSFADAQAKIESYDAKIAEFTADKEALQASLDDALAQIEAFKKDDDKKDNNDDKKDDDKKDDDDDKKKDDDKSKSSLDNSAELQSQLDEFKSQLEAKDAEISRLNSSISDLNNEKSELESFKKSIDTEKKNAIIAEFAEHLTEEQTANFNAKMDDYSVEDFKKEVCFAAYNTDSSIISGKGEEDKPDLIFKNNAKNTDSGVIALLLKHKGGNR